MGNNCWKEIVKQLKNEILLKVFFLIALKEAVAEIV